MTVEVARDLRGTIREYMADELEVDRDMGAASRRVCERIIAENMAVDVLRAIGPAAIADIWSAYQSIVRSEAFAAVMPDLPATDASRPANHGHDRKAPGATVPNSHGAAPRRFGGESLRARRVLMELEYSINGKRAKLGEMMAHHCRTLAQDYASRSRTLDARGRVFLALEERLPAGKRIDEVLTEDDLAAIFGACGAQPGDGE